MAHVSYPATFPVECISDLIQIVRGGFDEIVARKAEVGSHVWNIQGFGQAMLLGTPDGPFTAMNAEEESDIEERLNEFADALASSMPDKVSAAALAEVKSPVASSAPGVRKIDWARWIKFFLEVVLPIITVV